MYLLDTNHCSGILESDVAIVQKVTEVGTEALAIAFATAGELRYMSANSDRPAENRIRVDILIGDIGLYYVDDQTIDEYAHLKAAIVKHFGPREKPRRRTASTRALGFDDNDIWIAAVALRHNLIVVSSDSDFTRMREVSPLAVESWWSPSR